MMMISQIILVKYYQISFNIIIYTSDSKPLSCIKVEYTWNLSKPEICFSLCAIWSFPNLKHFSFYVFCYLCKILTTISKQCAAKVLISSLKPDHNSDRFIGRYCNFLVKHDIAHFIVNVCLGELCHEFLGGFTSYLVFIGALEIYICRSYVVDTKTCKKNIFLWHESNSIKSFLI